MRAFGGGGERVSSPTGLGVWVRYLDPAIHGDPGAFAARLSAHHVSFALLLAVGQDDDRGHVTVPRRMLVEYAEALREMGVSPWLWAFPRAGWERRLLEDLEAAREAVRPDGLAQDPELSYKGRPDKLAELMAGTLDIMREGVGLLVSSYGAPWWHRDLPWREMGGYGVGSPQLYVDDDDVSWGQLSAHVSRSLAAWRGLQWTSLVPSIPAYGAQSGSRLRRYLSLYEDEPGVDGLAAWSEQQLSGAEWAALARWAERR